MSATALAARPAPFGLSRHIGRAACVVVPLAFWFAPLPLEPTTQHALAIASFMVLAWITEAMDHAVTGLIGCFLFWALDVVRFNVAFGGFATDTAWFLLGAMLIGVVASKIRARPPARLLGDAARRDHISAHFVRPHPDRLPADAVSCRPASRAS